MAALLAVVTLALYWRATRCDFVNYDDPLYVTANSHVQAGLSWQGLAWAFTQTHGEGTYWHPLTWLSHMLDCQLYGVRPWGHHLTSVLLHAANVVLVFLVFRRMTGAFWRCAALAALFALHPLQVDSVAWVTERKTLLSAFFWLLTTWAYLRYVEGGGKHTICNEGVEQGKARGPKSEGRKKAESRSPKAEGRAGEVLLHAIRDTQHATRSTFYLLSLLFFALGLMCKPMLVTLPFVLLLLDYWPLGRSGSLEPRVSGLESTQGAPRNTQHATRRILLEKVPFLALAAASSVVTILAHQALGSLESASSLPLNTRIENALVSYVRYLGKTLWPSHLAVLYPYPRGWPMWEIVACGLLLLALFGLALGAARSRPWLLVGWFWFLGVLVPFIGLIQAGAQAMADRFMYVPIIGIFLAIIWGVSGWAGSGRHGRLALAAAGSAAVVLCLAMTRQQLGYWRDSEALFRHALDVTENNCLAHNNLGNALAGKDQLDEAITHYHAALAIKPDYAEACNNLGSALYRQGRTDEAINQFKEAIRWMPDQAEVHSSLGTALASKGRLEEAIRQFREAIRLKPDQFRARNNLGVALASQGQLDEAIAQYQQALRLRPDDAEAHNNLGAALYLKGRTDEAISQYQEVIRLLPNQAEAHNNLGAALARNGRSDDAIRQYQEALRLKPDYADARKNLERALAAKARSSPPSAVARPPAPAPGATGE
ncbi:MAG TPA: tetratricopeptide repeat protein [Candidatus Acidoferrum sp.]|nr:tetratricopeptide repeat protein [Candidatus Acidoferrum sp.]